MVGLFILIFASLATLLARKRKVTVVLILLTLVLGSLMLWYHATDTLQTNW